MCGVCVWCVFVCVRQDVSMCRQASLAIAKTHRQDDCVRGGGVGREGCVAREYRGSRHIVVLRECCVMRVRVLVL